MHCGICEMGLNCPNSVRVHLNIKMVFSGMDISIIKTRQSWDCLIFIMEIPIPLRQHVYIETAPWLLMSMSYIVYMLVICQLSVSHTPDILAGLAFYWVLECLGGWGCNWPRFSPFLLIHCCFSVFLFFFKRTYIHAPQNSLHAMCVADFGVFYCLFQHFMENLSCLIMVVNLKLASFWKYVILKNHFSR